MDIGRLETMLEAGQDNALIRLALGTTFLHHAKYQEAIVHLRRAVEMDPGYSAAWKALGRALQEAGNPVEARTAYSSGLEAARARGDMQALRELEVFLRRLDNAPD